MTSMLLPFDPKTYFKEYYHKHRNEIIARNTLNTKTYRANNPEKYKAFPSSSKEYCRNEYHRVKSELFEILGTDCILCTKTFPVKLLEAHHFLHDGHLDRNHFVSSNSMYRYYVRHPIEAKAKLRPLCKKCHRSHH